MTAYHPDNFILIRVKDSDDLHIAGGWSGGYLSGDSWRLSTKVVSIEKEVDMLTFTSASGSVYKASVDQYRMSMVIASVLDGSVEPVSHEEFLKILKDCE